MKIIYSRRSIHFDKRSENLIKSLECAEWGKDENPLSTGVLDKRTSEETDSIVVAVKEEGVVAQDNRLEDMIVLDDSGNGEVGPH